MPLLSVSDIPLAECPSSLSDFVSSSVVVTITLACGTSVWMIAEPSSLRFNEKPFLTNLPSTYQPERECRVMMRLSPTFCEEEMPTASIACKSLGTVLRSLSQSLASWVLSTIHCPHKISTCWVLLIETSVVSRSAREARDMKHSMRSILYFLQRRYSICTSDSVKQ